MSQQTPETTMAEARLTHLVRCAGCASKIGPALLMGVLGGLPATEDERLLVGLATGDDAGVYRISADTALVQTLDFFTPIVDDPYLFGQIAAANALSDVYAMGGRPITAMNIVCFPIKERHSAELFQILKGGAEKVAEAGAALVGGHSVMDQEPKYGLSVTGIVHPDHITTNAGARPGDLIVLTKPIGTGIIATAAKFGDCPYESFEAAARGMTTLNAAAADAMRGLGIGPGQAVHAATDITGFSLIGHLFQMARASGVSIQIDAAAVPTYPGALQLAESGNTTAGGKANLEYVSSHLTIEPGLPPCVLDLLTDPQTSGGLAICVCPDDADRAVGALRAAGTLEAAIVGSVQSADRPEIVVHGGRQSDRRAI